MEPTHIETAIYGADDCLWSYHIGNYYLWSWLPMEMPMELFNMELLPICGADDLQRRLPVELLDMELLLRKLTTYWAITYTYWLATYRSDYPMEPTIYWGATCATDYLWYWLSMELITWGAFSIVTHDSGLYGSFAHFPSTACSLGTGKTSSILDPLMD